MLPFPDPGVAVRKLYSLWSVDVGGILRLLLKNVCRAGENSKFMYSPQPVDVKSPRKNV